MHVPKQWAVMAVALVVAACGSAPVALTPPPTAPAAATATNGPETPTRGVSATGSPEAAVGTPNVTPTPSPTVRPTATPTSGPSLTPRPTSIPRPTPPRPPATPRPTPTPAASSLAIRIADFAFSPATVTVRVGTRVTWTNRQLDVQHTVTADGGSFGSGPLSTGTSFSHVFTLAGTYLYHCSIHSDMTGTVIVGG